MAKPAQAARVRQRGDLLATLTGLAEGRRVRPALQKSARPARPVRRHRLVAGMRRFGERSSQKRGQKVGPNPTDCGKSGSKRNMLTDAFGLPRTVVLTAANVHDSKVFEQLLDAVPPIKPSGRGRPRKRPKKLHADKGYNFPHVKRALHKRGIRVRIARRGKDSSRRLGRHRCVIERTLACLSSYRRLTIRRERRAELHEAFLHLACAVVCFGRWIRRREVVQKF